jgi:hypothetical protein
LKDENREYLEGLSDAQFRNMLKKKYHMEEWALNMVIEDYSLDYLLDLKGE